MNPEDRAFRVLKVDLENGETTIVIKNGLIGPVASQLTIMDSDRKAYRIVRKLGHVLHKCGDGQYGKRDFDENDTDVDPSVIIGDFRPSNPG